jgi:hypothetical protein
MTMLFLHSQLVISLVVLELAVVSSRQDYI